MVKLIEYKYKEWTERDQNPVQCFFFWKDDTAQLLPELKRINVQNQVKTIVHWSSVTVIGLLNSNYLPVKHFCTISVPLGVNNIMQVQMAMDESMFWERYMSELHCKWNALQFLKNPHRARTATSVCLKCLLVEFFMNNYH